MNLCLFHFHFRDKIGLKNWQWQQKQWLSQQEKKQPDTDVDDLPEPASSELETPKNQLDKIRRRMNAFGLTVPVLTFLKSGIERIFLNKDEDNEQGQQEGEQNQSQANETVVTTSKPFIRIYSK